VDSSDEIGSGNKEAKISAALEHLTRNKEAEISAALERLWVRFLPEIRARVEILEASALALAGGTLSSTQRESAASAAHKLAGTLGTFSLVQGTIVARELEQLYGGDGPSPEIAAQMARELREMVEGRAMSAAS
jgi:HPt (histidine-containing phosphotransfer) domain-containing protein